MGASGMVMKGGIVSLAALGLLLSPVLAAPADRKKPRFPRTSLMGIGGLRSFTPAVSDPRLAAAFARRGGSRAEFSFTPAATPGDRRAVRIAVRARAATPVAAARAPSSSVASADVPALAPTAYNLGVAVGWKRFAISGDVAKVDAGLAPGGREAAEVGISYNLKDFTGRVQVGADRPDPHTPRLIANDINYSLDVGGSYSVARNIELTGGVRYKIERERLAPLSDSRRDSQAVYVGTAFKF